VLFSYNRVEGNGPNYLLPYIKIFRYSSPKGCCRDPKAVVAKYGCKSYHTVFKEVKSSPQKLWGEGGWFPCNEFRGTFKEG